MRSCLPLLLTAAIFVSAKTKAQGSGSRTPAYGNNPVAGHYLLMKDGVQVYYELYGKGRPVVLLHGGLFGDISEYEELIPHLAEHFQVIAIETRGHGRSGIGHTPFTYSLMAEDAYAVIRHVTTDSTMMIGFSDGAVVSMVLTLRYPDLVKKLVFAGGNLTRDEYKPGELDKLKAITGESIEKDFPDFVKDRKALMPEPARWNEFVALLKHAWLEPVYMDTSKVRAINCPVLIAGGDRDQYNSLDSFVDLYHRLPHASLAIVPDSDHIIFYRKPGIMERLVMDFLSGY